MGDGDEPDDDGVPLSDCQYSRGSSHVALLPVHLREGIVGFEAERFVAAVDGLATEWNWQSPEGSVITHKLQNSLRWISLLNRRVETCRAEKTCLPP